jgi:uncharacterized membrane protein
VLVARDPFDVTWRERVAVLGAAAGMFLTALVLGLIYAHDATIELLGLVPASIFAIGKFLPLWGIGGNSHFNPWQLGLVIWVLDTYTVITVVYGLEALYRIRPLERALARVQTNASLVLAAYPRIRRAAVVGVIVFVLFPVAGTGALVGAFLGILLGLHRSVLIAAVSLGGLSGGMLMAFAAVNFGEAMQRLREIQNNPAVKYATIAVIVVALVVAFMWLNRIYRRALAAARATGAASDVAIGAASDVAIGDGDRAPHR